MILVNVPRFFPVPSRDGWFRLRMTWQLERYRTVDSTMRIAAGKPVGAVIVADHQTAGIGRHGHEWESRPDEGLYVSMVVEPHPVLTLALGIAAQAALEQATHLRCDIRWPNDLMLGDKKLGGILVELHGEQAIAGIGINIGQRSFPPDLKQIATSLALETGLDFRRDDILEALLPEVERHTAQTTGQIIARWEQASGWARGKCVEVDGITGITSGLDTRGFLLIRTRTGELTTIYAGGVRPCS